MDLASNPKYSKALKATYLDKNGKEQLIVMGSHGIGISRTLAAVVEQYNDEFGIKWPMALAPFHVIITVVNSKKEDQQTLGEEIYKSFKAEGIEVLFDDRKERAGVKFKDAELIGIPLRVNVGRDASESLVEFKLRSGGDAESVHVDDLLEKIKKHLV